MSLCQYKSHTTPHLYNVLINEVLISELVELEVNIFLSKNISYDILQESTVASIYIKRVFIHEERSEFKSRAQNKYKKVYLTDRPHDW